ncbi:hypothetical protein PMM47T1_18850 [Pseudomonas sp. M47T1]|uniref:hypothetical protein n=1 Tax=Pseudomonas sp. M47T1 TaxID=1179778 RepID=UPI0002606C15|nr:hypothetical protein [Pseudomonas sp. M47T1]EIK95041.1 hypothetical protein PMM47T1_18850 [Pseudomonas sp. M47T1]
MHPEHFDLSSPLFLPVTAQTCESLLNADSKTALATLSDPELAAILVIQNLAQAAEKDLTPDAAERVLAKLIGWAVDTRQATPAGLLSEAQRLFDPRKVYFGLNAIKSLKLRFLLADEVAAGDYLLPNGKWDTGFRIRHHKGNNPFSQHTVTPRHREHWLSAAQDKLLRTFRANLDEHLHVQGYAGIGKSHLVGALIECLRPGQTLMLARTPAKLATLRARMGSERDKKSGSTFEAFAQLLLHGPGHQPARGTARVASKQAIAQELNILGFRNHDAQAALDVCLNVLERYCHSRDHTLSAKHLPHFKQALAPVDARVLLEYASRVWTYLETNPAWGSQLEFNVLWMIKRAALDGHVVPARYTHILIDESQDIPAPLLQIIERGRQVLVTLGDEYQQAKGLVVKRKREVRQNDINYSVRSGPNVERLVNPLISLHSEKSKAYFEGARDADVGIEHYPQGFVPPEGCVVLTASPWDTMKWVMQLHDANCGFSFIAKKGFEQLTHFMTTAIALFKPNYYNAGQSAEGIHPHFSELSDWQQVRDANRFDQSFLWVEAALDKGFKVADMTRLSRLLGQPGKSCTLMMAEDAGGMEFDCVLLTPELLTTEKFKDAYEFDRRICAVYIAISRARQQLYLPYDLVEWIEYHKARDFREMHGY